MFRLLIFLFIFSSLCGIAQTYPDKIYTKEGIIQCKINQIDNKYIYFKYPRKEWLERGRLLLDSINSYYWISKGSLSDSLIHDSLKFKLSEIKISHLVGGGGQWLSPISGSDLNSRTDIHYSSPAPYGFYRFIFSDRMENQLSLSISGYRRQGYGSLTGIGLAGGRYYKGTFNLIRLDLGINYYWSFGKRRGTSYGIGTSLGLLTFAEGNVTEYDWIGSGQGYQARDKLPINTMLNKITFGTNMELNQRFKISSKCAAVIGIKFILETPDGFSTVGHLRYNYVNLGQIAVAFLAFKFGKKPKEKIQS